MNLMKKWGIVALVLAFALVLAGCGPAAPETHTVTFNANGGTIPGSGNTKAIAVDKGTTITAANLPTATHTDLTKYFWGWYTSNGSPSWGVEFTSSTPVTADLTVYARWGNTAEPTKYTVTFNANGGTFIGGGTTRPIQVIQGDSVGSAPEVARSGYMFNGWKTNTDGTGNGFYPGDPVYQNVTFYAQWVQVQAINGSFNGTIGEKDLYFRDFLINNRVRPAANGDYDGNYANYSFYNSDTLTWATSPLTERIPGTSILASNNKVTTFTLGTPGSLYSVLNLIANSQINPGSTVTTNNSSAKYYNVSQFYLQDYPDIYLRYRNPDDNTYVEFWYADQDVTITGSYTSQVYSYNDETGEWDIPAYQYNSTYALDLKQGWNYVKRINGGSNSDALTATFQPDAGVKWVVDDNRNISYPDIEDDEDLYLELDNVDVYVWYNGGYIMVGDDSLDDDYSYWKAWNFNTQMEEIVPLTDYVSGSSIMVDDGKAAIVLGTPVSYSYAGSMLNQGNVSSNLAISNYYAKYYQRESFDTEDGEKELYCVPEAGGIVQFWYTDSAVTINGTYVNSGTPINWTYTYALDLHPGWNYVKYANDSATRTQTYTSFDPETTAVQWIVDAPDYTPPNDGTLEIVSINAYQYGPDSSDREFCILLLEYDKNMSGSDVDDISNPFDGILNDFVVIVDGEEVTPSTYWHNQFTWETYNDIRFFFDTGTFVPGQTYQIKVIYTADDARIQSWTYQGVEYILDSFDTGVKTVTARTW